MHGAPSSVIRRRVVVEGGVQGVGYRYACSRRAHRVGVAGFVRNRDDGTVEAAFEGPPEAVEALVAWCRTGPPGAAVAGVAVTEEAPIGVTGFDVTG